MSELTVVTPQISQDFLSKDNSTFLYKTIISKYKLEEYGTKEKKTIIDELIEIMKNQYKILQFSKINNSNVLQVKKQFNDICLKNIAPFITKITENEVKIVQDNRKYERDFNTIKSKVVFNERPISSSTDHLILSKENKKKVSIANNPSQSVAKKISNSRIDNSNKINQSSRMDQSDNINDRLKELEAARQMGQPPRNQELPDFLKQVKVGKTNDTLPSTSQSLKLSGYNNDSNYSNISSDQPNNNNKYNDNISIQDRLAQIENERNSLNANQLPSQQMAPHQMPPQQMPPQSMQPQSMQPQSMQPQSMQPQSMQPQQMPPQSMQPQQMPPQSMPPQQMPPQSMQPQSMQPQSMQPQQMPPQSMQPQQMPPQSMPSQQKQSQPMQNIVSYSQTINMELDKIYNIIGVMKHEIDSLKKNKKIYNKKILQLEVNKTDSSYKYLFNPINNIVLIKIISYYLPPPRYNVLNDSIIEYKIDSVDKTQVSCIIIKKGYYNIDTLIERLNQNEDLFFTLDITQKLSIELKDKTISNFTLINSDTSSDFLTKLGFNMSQSDLLADYKWKNNTLYIADNFIDLRLPNKLLLYIDNLQDDPVGVLNFNNSSICDISFKVPTTLDHLNINFMTEDNKIYDFNNILYNLSFQIDIIEN